MAASPPAMATPMSSERRARCLGCLERREGLARIEAECAQGGGHIDAPGEQGLVSEKALEQRVLCHGAINDPKKGQMRLAHGRVRGARHGGREPASVVCSSGSPMLATYILYGLDIVTTRAEVPAA